MHEGWRISLLGGLRAERDGFCVSHFRSRMTAALLAYLALYQDRSHPREELVERFWPESDLDAGRASLRTALSSLRRQLEPPAVIVADATSVALRSGSVTVDAVELFRADSASRRLDAKEHGRRAELARVALEGETGDLLPGFYDEWVLDARAQLHQARLRLLRLGLGSAKEMAEDPLALRYAQALAEADLLDRPSNAEYVRMLAESGQTSEARTQYDRHAAALSRELGEEPSEEIRRFAQGLGPGAPTLPRAGNLRMGQLPSALTRFFGREAETESLLARWKGGDGFASRLVTLTGSGGIGKTRLAIEAARTAGESFFAGRVWFVPLAGLQEADQIPAAIESTIFADADRARPMGIALDRISEVLSGSSDGPSLLVLDNFEQLAEGGAPIVRELLDRVRNLFVLATSRRLLGVEGEQAVPILPLPVPLPGRAGSPRQLEEFPSVRLFLDRARLARSDFGITVKNAEAVRELSERLEGVPLAVELAAARAAVLSPEQMLEQLQGRLDFLATSRRDLPDRHRTLRAAIAWSFETLEPEIGRSFSRLSVLRGSWDMEDAEAVAGLEAIDALDALSELHGASLILRDEETDGAETRFRMLEVIREFAAERLTEAERLELGRRHFERFLSVVEGIAPGVQGRDQARSLEQMESHLSNFRAALRWALESSEGGEGALRMAVALAGYWRIRGHWREGVAALEEALRQRSASDRLRAAALHQAGVLWGLLGDYRRSMAMHEDALRLARHLEDRAIEADALHELGILTLAADDVEGSTRMLRASLDIRRELGDQAGEALSLNNLGNLAFDQTEFPKARELYEQSLLLRRRLGDLKGVAACLNNLGNLQSHLGQYDSAFKYLKESLAIWRTLGDKWGISLGLGNLAEVARLGGDLAEAHRLNAQCVSIRWEIGDRKLLAGSYESYGHLLADEGRWSEATIMLAAAQAIRDVVGLSIRPSERATYEENIARVRRATGEEEFHAAWSRGLALRPEEALDFALNASRDEVGTRSLRAPSGPKVP